MNKQNILLNSIFTLVSDTRSPFRLSLGFIVHQSIGYSRDFPFDIPQIQLDSDLDLEALSGVVRVTRTPQGLLFQLKMQATTHTECVRCLTNFAQSLDADFTELYAFTPRSVTESNLILPEDGKIDLEPLLREYMLLSMPIKPLCKPDCKGLCPVCGENLNVVACGHTLEQGDPRMAKFTSLLDP
jgi:uncharacterized protein